MAHLRYEDCGHCLIERGAVHVDCGADGQHEPTHTGVHAWAVLVSLITILCSALYNSAEQYSAVLCSIVQYGAGQCSLVQYKKCYMVQYSTV